MARSVERRGKEPKTVEFLAFTPTGHVESQNLYRLTRFHNQLIAHIS